MWFNSEGIKILTWDDVRVIAERFKSLDPNAVKGSIFNLVDANYIDSDSKNEQRQLYGYSIAAKRYALYEKVPETEIKIVDPKATCAHRRREEAAAECKCD